MSNIRIQRYIISEISVPALLGLIAFSFVLLLGRMPRLTEMIINKGVPFVDIIELFSYLLPTFFSVTLPLSFLLGILIAFGRLSADSEYIAMKASGISLWSLVVPVALLALTASIMTAAITLVVEPASKSAFRDKLFQIASDSAGISIKPGIFNDEFPGIVLHAQSMDEQRGIMHNLFIADERDTETPVIISARQGRIISDLRTRHVTLRLHQGTIHRQPGDRRSDNYQTIHFSTYDINFDVGSQLDESQRRRSRSELTATELYRQIAALSSGREKLRLQAELHERIAIACAPLVLILIGIPLGLQSQRSGKGAGFTLALAIFLIYYVLLSFSGTLVDKQMLPAAVILWLPNIVFLIAGSFFLYRTAIERPVLFHQLLWQQLLQKISRNGAGGPR